MKNYRWLSALFNTRKQPMFLGLFGKRRRSRGPMYMSIIGVLATMVSAAFYGFARGRDEQGQGHPVRRFTDQMKHTVNNAKSTPRGAAFAEFADEVMPEPNNQREPKE